jgi:prefoldin subunit 5
MDFQLNTEELYEAFERLKAENYHLKRQLKNKNNLINGKDKYIKKLEREAKEFRPAKQHYKNGKRDNQRGSAKR